MIHIRLATLDEIPVLGDLMQRSVRALGPSFYSPEHTEAAARFLTIPDPTIIEDGTYFAVEKDTQIIGCGGWSRRRKLFTGSLDQEELAGEFLDPKTDAAKIRAMFVDPGNARQGVGELIYRTCEKAALDASFRRLELMGTLPGVPFYRRMGFLEEGNEDVVLPDGSSLPCIRMAKQLSVE